jgi:hypothetical protein
VRWLRRTLAAALAAILVAVLVLLSRLPWTVEPESDALVRLSWRSVGERVEECREPSEAELAALPRHMRQPKICEGRVAPFRLRVELDGAAAVDELVRAAGAREDRPVYVFRELRVPPGEHRLAVHFAAERPRGASAAESAPLLLEETLVLAPRSVALVSYDADAGRLVVVGPPRR